MKREPEDDQGRRRRGPALLERAAEDRVDEEEGEQRAERRSPTPAGTAKAASARSRRPR